MRYLVSFRSFGRKSRVLEFSTIENPHKKAFDVVVFFFSTSLKRLCYQLFGTNEIILILSASVPIPRRPTDSEFFPGHTFYLFDNLRCDLLWAAFFVPGFLTCNRFSGGGTFFDHLALEFRKAQHDLEYQAASRGIVY